MDAESLLPAFGLLRHAVRLALEDLREYAPERLGTLRGLQTALAVSAETGDRPKSPLSL